MDQLALFFVIALAAIVMVPLGERLMLPAPVLMTLLGVVLALIPQVPNVHIEPSLILPLLLPPLLYAAVQRTSWRQFAINKRAIFLLAVGLVFVTTGVVAAVANAIVPGISLAGAFALGAIVAPPDPVAATAVAGALGLPRRMISILEGEGLFNDVTAIVLYNVAVAAAVSGEFSVSHAVLELLLNAVVAVVIGLVLGWGTNKLMTVVGEPTLQIGLSLLVPYAAYVLTQELHGSGVLAVLTTALFLAEHAFEADDVQARLVGNTFWEIVDTLVTGIAFGLIGLELHNVFAVPDGHWEAILRHAGLVVAVVVFLRLLYLMPASLIARRLHKLRDVYEDIPMTWQETVIMWWSGMRGVVSVALALALPLTTHHHLPFPARQELLFIAFAVALATLVVQGLTLPWLVKRLEVGSDIEAEHDLERALAVRAMTAARVRLKEIERNETLDEELSEILHRRAFEVGTRISPDIVEYERRDSHARRLARIKALRHFQEDMLSAARHEVLAARSEPGIDPEVVDRVLRHLDLRSMRGL
ncbi:sodium/proton antiporter, CPA1 family [Streptomyces sp. DvalAA-14]|uniref:Na+/H+ antiporter n=1 Tax=unclassified Streptomyces TaxID=2593676 RepID=UPI00081B3039|nr:Na+/H+ antiporter [Streptomyces sp. DvalAA-14]MYS19614.1 Na+/H+ antiporter [Streptomyces sp. SID4948]SCD48771.1 sodium/proton antiporter, CPA1 family [Streptomyces sp. DvalAA-14]